MVHIEAVLLCLVVGEDILPLSEGVVAPAVLVGVFFDGGAEGCGGGVAGKSFVSLVPDHIVHWKVTFRQ